MQARSLHGTFGDKGGVRLLQIRGFGLFDSMEVCPWM